MNSDSGCAALTYVGPIGILFLIGGLVVKDTALSCLAPIGYIVFALCVIIIIWAFFIKEPENFGPYDGGGL